MLMKIPAGRARPFQFHSRFPQFVRNQMQHAVFDLELAGNTKKAHRLRQDRIALKDAFPHDDVYETGFVFEGHEYDAARGAGPLAANHQTGIANLLAIFHRRYGTRVGQVMPRQAWPHRLERMASRTMPSPAIIPTHFFEVAQRRETRPLFTPWQ